MRAIPGYIIEFYDAQGRKWRNLAEFYRKIRPLYQSDMEAERELINHRRRTGFLGKTRILSVLL